MMPLVLLRLAWRGLRNPAYWTRLPERFGVCEPPPEHRCTAWVHAVSVGEVQAAAPVIRRLLGGDPPVGVLVTTTTPTGAEWLGRIFGDEVPHRYMPWDLPGCVNRFLDTVRPVAAIIMETELWPNVVNACARRSIPVVLANARLSERSAAGYRRLQGVTRDMLHQVSVIAAQSREDADRLIALGAAPEKVCVTGSVKFDIRTPASVTEEGQVLRRI